MRARLPRLPERGHGPLFGPGVDTLLDQRSGEQGLDAGDGGAGDVMGRTPDGGGPGDRSGGGFGGRSRDRSGGGSGGGFGGRSGDRTGGGPGGSGGTGPGAVPPVRVVAT
ncbi:hypothetical protein A4U61_14420 [Streptomyces sp. H-KF8]|nr:hypothetical protein A4U61_14420 [Streptomyces sp. H-KF8]